SDDDGNAITLEVDARVPAGGMAARAAEKLQAGQLRRERSVLRTRGEDQHADMTHGAGAERQSPAAVIFQKLRLHHRAAKTQVRLEADLCGCLPEGVQDFRLGRVVAGPISIWISGQRPEEGAPN